MAMTRNSEIRGLVAGLFEEDFPFAQSLWAEGFLGLLVEMRHVFGNDMDKVMILAAIGQRMLRDPQMRHLTPRQKVLRSPIGRAIRPISMHLRARQGSPEKACGAR